MCPTSLPEAASQYSSPVRADPPAGEHHRYGEIFYKKNVKIKFEKLGLMVLPQLLFTSELEMASWELFFKFCPCDCVKTESPRVNKNVN